MTTEFEEAVDVLGAAQNGEQSIFDALTADRDEMANTREALISIPGYGRDGKPALLAKYKLLEGPEVVRLSRLAAKGQRDLFQQNLMAAIALMIRACIGIYVQRPGDKEPIPLTLGGIPIEGFDHRLGTAMRCEDDDPALIVLHVFGGNDIGLVNHAMRLNTWFGNTNADVNEAFLGEAGGAT